MKKLSTTHRSPSIPALVRACRIALALAAAPLAAHAITIDFESDTPGNKPNGFQSVQSGIVSFSDSDGEDLDVVNDNAEGIGNVLRCFGDDSSALQMTFSSPVNSLSILFGNDDPSYSNPGDMARLTLYSGGNQVGQVDVVMNRNDAGDQTVNYSGVPIDFATFQYVNPAGEPIDLIEIVDNVTFELAPAEPITTLVALKGTAVPGEPVGTLYTGFGTPSFDGNEVDFLAKIKGPDGSKKAIVLGTPQAVAVRTGDLAPGASLATFKAFKDPVFTHGAYAVTATIAATDGSVTKTSDTGIWSNAVAPLRLVAREGSPAPGANGAIFKTFLSLALPPQPAVVIAIANGTPIPPPAQQRRGAVFVAKLASDGAATVDSTNDVGLWREVIDDVLPPPPARAGAAVVSTATAELLLREGQQVDVSYDGTPDLRTVKSFTCLKSISRSPGHGRFGADGALSARLSFTDGTQAIVGISPIDTEIFVFQKTGDVLFPDPASPVFKKFGVPAFYAGSFGTTVLATLKTGVGGVTTANDSGIFDFANSDFAGLPYVTEGDPAVGAGSGNNFYKFKDPTTSMENIAYIASLKKNPATGVTSTNDYGLWKGVTDNPVAPTTLVAREGDEGFGIPGSAIKSFLSQALPDLNGGPLFTAKLVPGTGGITTADAFAFWANQGVQTNKTFLLVQQGHPLTTDDATTYGIRTVTVLKAVSGSPGQPRAYNNNGGVTYKAKIDGGLEGIFRVQLPPPPEENAPTLSATGSNRLGGHRKGGH